MISFRREKRLLLGLVALAAPLPLPFNEILGWPLFALYALAVVIFLRRARNPEAPSLPLLAVNLLGGLYLAVFVVDLALFSGGRPVGPVIHLLLFAVVVKLFSLARERDKWQALIAIIFLFLASMATSTHPTVVIYLLAFAALLLLILLRFAYLHLLASFGRSDRPPARVPLARFLALASLASVLLAVPLFAILPRVRSPYLVGAGGGAGRGFDAPGFTSEVTLDSIGLNRDNPEVVLRLRFAHRPPPGTELRIKAGAHERYRNGVWHTMPAAGRDLRHPPGSDDFILAERTPTNTAEVFLQPVLENRMALPVEAVRVTLESWVLPLRLSDSGSISLPMGGPRAVRYRVGLGPEPRVLSRPPALTEDSPALDTSAVSAEVAALAAQVMGSGTARERAERLQSFFYREFEYTTDFVGRGGAKPIDDFLFKYRSGHCEYFATAMVLMLRSQGIPSRLATGFLGGDVNRLEGFYIVRQRNAHAWVEAYLPEEGWAIFDPTPPDGRPSSSSLGLFSLLTETWDFLVFGWDRYVISYGVADQAQFLLRMRDLWQDLWRSLAGKPEALEELAPRADLPEPKPGAGAAREPQSTLRPAWVAVPAAVLLGALGLWLWLRRRRRSSATERYLELRRLLSRAGLPVGKSVPPLALAWAVELHHPAASPAARQIVSGYLAESFGGQIFTSAEREAFEQAWTTVREAFKRAKRRSRE